MNNCDEILIDHWDYAILNELIEAESAIFSKSKTLSTNPSSFSFSNHHLQPQQQQQQQQQQLQLPQVSERSVNFSPPRELSQRPTTSFVDSSLPKPLFDGMDIDIDQLKIEMVVPLVNDDPMIDNETEDLDEVLSDSDSEDVKLAEPSKNAVNNREAILDKLGDISWPENVDWKHKLSIDIDQEQEVDVNDDLARELSFYTQALEGTRQAFEKLESMGLPFLRPADYYAEMVKADSHMEKVKSRLLEEKRKMEEADERRKAREAKRLSKEIQSQKLKERAKQKKEDIESVKKWRKQRQQSGFADGGDGPDKALGFEDGKVFERSKKKRPGVSPGDRSGGKAKQASGKGKMQKKRDTKNSKFGFGGRKGSKKQNTADTTNDFGGFGKAVAAAGNKKRKR